MSRKKKAKDVKTITWDELVKLIMDYGKERKAGYTLRYEGVPITDAEINYCEQDGEYLWLNSDNDTFVNKSDNLFPILSDVGIHIKDHDGEDGNLTLMFETNISMETLFNIGKPDEEIVL